MLNTIGEILSNTWSAVLGSAFDRYSILIGNKLTFDLICLMFPAGQILDYIQWEKRRADIALKRAWIEIAADCHLITTKCKISSNELTWKC
jgi:hypothetical protein